LLEAAKDLIRQKAPVPEWLEKSREGAQQRRLDKLTMEDIDAEIAAYRREKKNQIPSGPK